MLGVLEMARLLLRLEAVRRRVEEQGDAIEFDPSSPQGTREGAGGKIGSDGIDGSDRESCWASNHGDKRRRGDEAKEVEKKEEEVDEEEETELKWKTGRFMELFLSKECQVRAG